jgi:hypothetical protein
MAVGHSSFAALTPASIVMAVTAATIAITMLGPGSARAQGARRVTVHGAARIELTASRKAGKLVVSGKAADDAGKALEGRVALSLEHPGDLATKVPLPADAAQRCESSSPLGAPGASAGGPPPPPPPPIVPDGTGGVSVETDAAGRFCVLLSLPIDRYVVKAQVAASELLDAGEGQIAVDLERASVSLSFDPEHPVLWLDGAPATIEAALAADDEAPQAGVGAGLAIELANEAGTPLGHALTDASGRVRFVVDGAKLGAPGQGELRLSFAGNAALAAGSRVLRVERRTHVDLVLPAGEGPPQNTQAPRLPPGSPEDGIELHVKAPLRCAKQGCPGTATGTIEARLADTGALVGASPLEGGEARVIMTFPMPAAGVARLRLRYAPDAPWFALADERDVEQPLEPSSPMRRLPVLLAALLVVAIVGLARSPVRRRLPKVEPDEVIEGAHVEVVQQTGSAQGWSGTVIDAHDAVPVPGARLAIERPGMTGVEIVAQTAADSKGAFTLAAIATRPGDELVSDGPLHAPLRSPLPRAGVLKVALLQRKRAVLNEMVDWVKRRGEPFSFKGDPTPGELSAFAEGFRPDVAVWADAVEQTAYGGAPVDAAAHEAVKVKVPVEPAETRVEELPQPADDGHGQGSRGVRQLRSRPGKPRVR